MPATVGIACLAFLRGSQFSGIQYGAVSGRKIRVQDSEIFSNGSGINAYRKARLDNAHIYDNEREGFTGGILRAEGSTIDGNCLLPGPDCADIKLWRRRTPPPLVNTTCGTSLVGFGDPVVWETMGICSQD